MDEMTELYIHDENTLEKLAFLDDFESIVWNNRYFEAGEFEFIIPMTARNLQTVKRNRFVTRPNLKEIGIIETVSFYESNNITGLKASGRIADALLSRRIVWNSTLVNGGIIAQLRALIDKNLINPTDARRTIPSGSYEEARTGNTITKDAIFSKATIQSISAGVYVDKWQSPPTSDDKVYLNWFSFIEEQVCSHELNVQVSTDDPATAVVIGEMLKNPYSNVSDTIEKSGTSYKKIKRVAKETDLKTYLFNQVKNQQVEYTIHNDNRGGTMYKPMSVKIKTKFSSSTFFNWLSVRADDSGNIELTGMEYFSGYATPVQYCFIPRAVPQTSGSGATLVHEIVVTDPDTGAEVYSKYDDTTSESTLLMACGFAFQLLGYNVTFKSGLDGEKEERFIVVPTSAEEMRTPNHIKGYAIYDLETPEETVIDLSTISTKANTYRLTNNGAQSLGSMLMILSYISEYTPFLKLGTFPESLATIYEVVEGNNLGEYVASVLQSIGLGVRARYEESEKSIYIDFYAGENKTAGNGVNRPVIFSKEMDALNGFDITESSKSKFTIIRVKGKTDDKTFYAEAGAGAGLSRLENFQSINDVATYSGANYTESLATKGDLVLNGFERVIDADIDASTYEYRKHYNVGDVCTIIIKDFNLKYDVRILEVCESYDVNGYKITLVLGA